MRVFLTIYFSVSLLCWLGTLQQRWHRQSPFITCSLQCSAICWLKLWITSSKLFHCKAMGQKKRSHYIFWRPEVKINDCTLCCSHPFWLCDVHIKTLKNDFRYKDTYLKWNWVGIWDERQVQASLINFIRALKNIKP